MKHFINEVGKYIKFKIRQFTETRFFLAVVCLIIGSTFTYCYLVGKPYYEYIKTGLSYTKTIEIVRAEEVSPKVEQSTSWGEVVDENSTGSLSNESMEQNSNPQGIQALIARYFPANEVENALAIIKCESNFNQYAFNPTNGSNDRGIWQISKKYHPEVSDDCAYDFECSTKYAKKLYDNRGWDDWYCNKVII